MYLKPKKTYKQIVNYFAEHQKEIRVEPIMNFAKINPQICKLIDGLSAGAVRLFLHLSVKMSFSLFNGKQFIVINTKEACEKAKISRCNFKRELLSLCVKNLIILFESEDATFSDKLIAIVPSAIDSEYDYMCVNIVGDIMEATVEEIETEVFKCFKN